MKCEECGNDHDGSYGSGRFCSKKCRGAFCAKVGRKHLHKEPWVCDQCGEKFKSRKLMYEHKHSIHPNKGTWNKGLTKETDPRIAKGVETIKRHIFDGTVVNPWLGKHLPDEHKKKISESMKKPTQKAGHTTLASADGTTNPHGLRSGSCKWLRTNLPTRTMCAKDRSIGSRWTLPGNTRRSALRLMASSTRCSKNKLNET